MSQTLKTQAYLIAPVWWDRRALSVVKHSSIPIDWIDTSDAFSKSTLHEASISLANELMKRLEVDGAWLIIYGDAAPLGIEATKIYLAAVSGSSKLKGLLLISGTRTKVNLQETLKPFSGFRRISKRWLVSAYLRMQRGMMQHEMEHGTHHQVESMLSEAGLQAMQTQVELMMSWEGSRNAFDQIKLPVHQLHGRDDLYIKPPGVEEATLLGHAGHLLWFTHTDAMLSWCHAVAR